MDEIMEKIIRCISKNKNTDDDIFECVKEGASETQLSFFYGLNRYILNRSIENLLEDGYIKRLNGKYVLEEKAKDFLQSN